MVLAYILHMLGTDNLFFCYPCHDAGDTSKWDFTVQGLGLYIFQKDLIHLEIKYEMCHNSICKQHFNTFLKAVK